MKKTITILLATVLLLSLAGCGAGGPEAESSTQTPAGESTLAPGTAPGTDSDAGEDLETPVAEETAAPTEESNTNEEDTPMKTNLTMTIDTTPVAVSWENNQSVQALVEMAQEGPITIQMSMYGGFEQVGSIGRSLPRSDTQTTTQACDIVLYSGDQIVVFYGSNSWAYTRLGHITDKSASEMADLLGHGDVTITITAD